MLLDHVDQSAAATRIRTALGSVVRERSVRTRDMGGQASTAQFTDAIVAALAP
jgi:isocitrate/isopropylmalate dehydrogenase